MQSNKLLAIPATNDALRLISVYIRFWIAFGCDPSFPQETCRILYPMLVLRQNRLCTKHWKIECSFQKCPSAVFLRNWCEHSSPANCEGERFSSGFDRNKIQHISIHFEQQTIHDIPAQNISQHDENDWITLDYSGHFTYWRFPQTTSCPFPRCALEFSSGSEARSHYQQKHTKRTLLCPICDKPINSNPRTNYIKHHRMRHPDMKIPYDFLSDLEVQDITLKWLWPAFSYKFIIFDFDLFLHTQVDEVSPSQMQNECKTNNIRPNENLKPEQKEVVSHRKSSWSTICIFHNIVLFFS